MAELAEDPRQRAKSYSYGSTAIAAQCITTFVVSMTFFANGLFATIPTVVVGYLLHSKSDILSLTEEEASWFGALPFLLQPIGAVAGILMQDYVGQRYGLALSHVLAFIFYITLYYANSTSVVILLGVVMGLSQGFTEPSAMSYITEYSETRLRGYMCSGAFSMMSIGMLLEFIIVTIVDWRTALLINAAVSVLSLLLLPWMPDSPVWLLSKAKKRKALRALAWFRGWVSTDDVEEEFADLVKYVKSSLSPSHITIEYEDGDSSALSAKKSNFELLSSVLERRTLYPLLLLSFIQITHCFAGSIGARTYAMNLFDSLRTPIRRDWLTVTSALANVAGNITVTLILKYTGKRKLALVSILLASLMSICLGVYVHYKDQLQLPWLFIPLFFVLVYVTSQGTAIPWLLMGEVFPVRTRHAGSGLFGVVFDLLLFFFFKTYFVADKLLGTEMYFVTTGIVGAIGCLGLYAWMPETEGKSLEEIEKVFSKK